MKKSILLTIATLLLGITSVMAQDSSIIPKPVHEFNLHEFAIRFSINIVTALILVRLIYYTRHPNKDFLFTLILFNCVNFLICFLLSGANLEVGFAFGLFAIFSIMRYRTVTVPIKEMGYLFLCVALGLINSLATTQNNYAVLLGSNAFVLIFAFIMENSTKAIPEADTGDKKVKNIKNINNINNINNITNGYSDEFSRQIIYERIDLIRPEMRNEMIADLRNRTGLPIESVDVLSIDLMHDTAQVRAFFGKKETPVATNGIEK